MPALSDPKLEAFAQALLLNIIAGQPRSKAAEAAARSAGYTGSSLGANARKRAQRRDVKARMVELAAPRQAAVETSIAIDIEGAKIRLAEIIRADSGLKGVKPTDVIAAVRQLSTMEGWDAPKRMEHTGANGERLFDPENLSDDQLTALEAVLASIAPEDPGDTDPPETKGQPH